MKINIFLLLFISFRLNGMEQLTLKEQVIEAAQRNDAGHVQKLAISARIDEVKACPFLMTYAVHFSPTTDLLEILLAKGVDVNGYLDAGDTPLMGAARSPKKSIILQRLLQVGARIDQICQNGREKTALCDAIDWHNDEAVKLLLTAGADPNIGKPLCDALEKRYESLAMELIDAGADVRAYDKHPTQSNCLLFCAVFQRSSVALIKKMLAFGALPDIVSKDSHHHEELLWHVNKQGYHHREKADLLEVLGRAREQYLAQQRTRKNP